MEDIIEKPEQPLDFFHEVLPPEIIVNIFGSLVLEDFFYVGLVCKTWMWILDAKEIWKRLFFETFKHNEDNSINKEIPVRWKRLYDTMRQADRWYKNNFSRMRPAIARQMHGRTQHHLQLTPKYLFLGIYDRQLLAIKLEHDSVVAVTKPLSELYQLPRDSYLNQTEVLSSNSSGKILLSVAYRAMLWDLHNLNAGSYPQLYTTIKLGSSCRSSFNSKFVCFSGSSKVNIIDLHQRCKHSSKFTLRFGTWYSDYNTVCPAYKRCALIVDEYFGCNQVFASLVNTDKLLLFGDGAVFIWTNSDETQFNRQLKKIELKGLGNEISNITEQLVIINGVRRHFVGFSWNKTMTTFIDLNDLDYQISLKTGNYYWIPRQHRIASSATNKITVFDMEKKTWLSKLQVQGNVQSISFSSGGSVLLAATSNRLYLIHWQSGTVVGTKNLDVPVTQIFLIHDKFLVLMSPFEVRLSEIDTSALAF